MTKHLLQWDKGSDFHAHDPNSSLRPPVPTPDDLHLALVVHHHVEARQEELLYIFGILIVQLPPANQETFGGVGRAGGGLVHRQAFETLVEQEEQPVCEDCECIKYFTDEGPSCNN